MIGLDSNVSRFPKLKIISMLEAQRPDRYGTDIFVLVSTFHVW